MRTFTLFTLSIFILLHTGCGDPTVTGSVKFADGDPLTGGMLVLQNENSQGIGELRHDGTFTVYQYKPGDGLKRGKYTGYISGAVIADDFGNTTPLIPQKYTDAATSGIVYDSDVHRGRLDIVIER